MRWNAQWTADPIWSNAEAQLALRRPLTVAILFPSWRELLTMRGTLHWLLGLEQIHSVQQVQPEPAFEFSHLWLYHVPVLLDLPFSNGKAQGRVAQLCNQTNTSFSCFKNLRKQCYQYYSVDSNHGICSYATPKVQKFCWRCNIWWTCPRAAGLEVGSLWHGGQAKGHTGHI